ncbi:MAG: TIGR02281 family clan AA aspartic protease, partial [Alphaproteobacteria bacterium]
MAKRVLLWFSFLLFMVVLYTLRTDAGRIAMQTLAAIVPGMAFTDRPGTMSFYRASDGHFHIDVLVNGKPVRFMVDTGASDVMLAPDVARTLGFNPDTLEFSKTYNTA